MGVDVNPSKVQILASGRSPILEARMDELVTHGNQAHRLRATTDAVAAVCGSDISFVCVGTPSDPHGKLDLAHIGHVCQDIGQGLARKSSYHLVVIRSTVLPGTTKSFAIPMLESASGKRAGVDFGVCYNPEFTREGTAVADFLRPAYTILGCDEPGTLTPLREIYQRVPGRIFETSLATAEMVKYVSNAFHAVKVSFANEVGTLAKHQGVDTQEVMEIFTSDVVLNISPAYLLPGFAFGGSCLPKDLRALAYRARELHLKLPLLDAVLPSNLEHIERAVEAIVRTKKKKIGMLGLSFKTGTDDLRESPQVHLIKRLLGEGFQVQVWDPYVSLGRLMGSNRQFIEEVIPHIGSLLVASLEEVVNTAEVVVVGTREAQKSRLSSLLRSGQTVIDLVNLDRAGHPEGAASYEGICW
jgi:GDP-mannose 6-dehydrogenase